MHCSPGPQFLEVYNGSKIGITEYMKSEEVMHGNDGMHVRGLSLFLSLLLIVINVVPSRLALPCFRVSLQHLIIIITNMSCYAYYVPGILLSTQHTFNLP